MTLYAGIWYRCWLAFRRTVHVLMASRWRVASLSICGVLTGFLILHPFSMLVFGYTHEGMGPSGLAAIAHSFHQEMWPMWAWYAAQGAVMGGALGLLLNRIILLEEIVPICAWCGRIRSRDADGGSPAEWQRLDKYLLEKGVQESHGICPSCASKYQIDIGDT